MFHENEDIHLFALIAEEQQLRNRGVAAQDAGDEAAADDLFYRADQLLAMIQVARATTIAGVIALLELEFDADDAAIASLREIDARLKARGWIG